MRYINEIVLINWLSHEHTVIYPSPGMNCITGTSNSGKSAIFRALQFIYLMGQDGYKSFHSGWIRHGCANATIRVKYSDGTMIERVKGEKNEVRLYKDGVVFYEKLKAGTVYDKEVLDFLGNPPFERTIGPFSFSHQLDPAFLLSQSKDAIPKIISKLSNSGDYDRSAEILKNENTSFNPIIKSSETKIKDIKKELELFDELDSDILKYDELEELFTEVDSITEDLDSLKNILLTARNKKTEVDSLVQSNEYEKEKLIYLNELDDLQDNVNEIESLKVISNNIDDKEQEISDLLFENTQAEYFVSKEFNNAIIYMDQCISDINSLEIIQNQFKTSNDDLEEAKNLQEEDELTLSELNDSISDIESQNSEYEEYMRKNNICILCGK